MLLLCLFRRDGEKKNYHGKERTKERKKGGGARKISKDERTQAGRNPGSCTSPERGILPFRSTQPSRRTGSLIKKTFGRWRAFLWAALVLWRRMVLCECCCGGLLGRWNRDGRSDRSHTMTATTAFLSRSFFTDGLGVVGRALSPGKKEQRLIFFFASSHCSFLLCSCFCCCCCCIFR